MTNATKAIELLDKLSLYPTNKSIELASQKASRLTKANIVSNIQLD